MVAISWLGVLLLLARASALHPLGWPACRLPQSPPRVAVAGCTGLAAARRSRSLSSRSCALDQHARTERTPGAISRAPAPRLCAGAPGRPAGVVPSWRRWLAAVAKTVLRLLSLLLPYWLMRRLPLRRPREPEEQPEVQLEVQPSADGAADATGLPQQLTSEVIAGMLTGGVLTDDDTPPVRAFDVDGIAILRLYPLPTTTPATSREATAAAAAAATASAAAAATASVAATASAAAAATASAAAATASAAAIASASPSGGAAPVEWQNALFDFGNRIGRGNDAATPAVLLDEVRRPPHLRWLSPPRHQSMTTPHICYAYMCRSAWCPARRSCAWRSRPATRGASSPASTSWQRGETPPTT